MQHKKERKSGGPIIEAIAIKQRMRIRSSAVVIGGGVHIGLDKKTCVYIRACKDGKHRGKRGEEGSLCICV